ncbi:MAG: hypothetical protein LBF40_04890 [Deltaproteobacteria bacterium]|jgi:hypothetical protein|nr:hypothetical protein [Deltaproteobacteria bacterium]
MQTTSVPTTGRTRREEKGDFVFISETQVRDFIKEHHEIEISDKQSGAGLPMKK